MLSNPVMGVLALAILWVNTLLVAGAALKEFTALRALGKGIRKHLVRGTVLRGAGPGGALCAHRVEQVGRKADSGDILFGDRSYGGEIFGGTLAIEDGSEVDIEALRDAEVWVPLEALHGAARADETTFEEASAAARKARGFSRTVTATIGANASLFVAGRIEKAGERQVLRPIDEPLRVFAFDPLVWTSRKSVLVLAFVVAELALAGVVTGLALWPPAFGVVSTVGGVLCLAYFLLVQPAGTAVREAVRTPSRAILRGTWQGPKAEDGALDLTPSPRS